jgi:hypothetical protein
VALCDEELGHLFAAGDDGWIRKGDPCHVGDLHPTAAAPCDYFVSDVSGTAFESEMEQVSVDPAIYPQSQFDADHRAGMEDAE